MRNGSESDVDCGGSCADSCADGERCKLPADCASGRCGIGGLCASASCNSGFKDGTETDVDCGGVCDPCASGKSCLKGSDCQSQKCSGGVCQLPRCDDGVKNGEETDSDCGGTCPADCADGKGCKAGADCQSALCAGGKCRPPSCNDGVRSPGETDLDCGGACQGCNAGGLCQTGADCRSEVCLGGICQSATCSDGAKNGSETATDCGGGACPPCAVGAACGNAQDCTSLLCAGGACQPPSCSDGIKNGQETAIDCGGPLCGGCATGLSCAFPADCQSRVCQQNACRAATCGDGVKNGSETDLDCGGSCGGCASGAACASPADCRSGVCTLSKCVDTCSDGVRNGLELGVDCGGPCPLCPPPDPTSVAPAVDQLVATNLASSVNFLFSGNNPIQTGVTPGAIDPKRVAVLRGRVVNTSNAALSGVVVTVLGHPEYGQTVSRADGKYDLAVNGGGSLKLKYELTGRPPVEREVQVPWQDFVALDDVLLLVRDSVVTTIDFSQPVQIHRAGAINDSSGTRRSTLLFFKGTQVGALMPNGTSAPLSGSIHVRSSEYTVGSTGPSAMPGNLPPSSGYTYATEFTVDEAVALGARTVTFSTPVVQYLENFLGMAVGGGVPSGAFDAEKGQWVGDQDGRVVKLLSITGGKADLDIDGSGVAASTAAYAALGVTDDERTALASLYSPGQTLWRVPLTHFSSWDFNWPFGFPLDAIPPLLDDIKDKIKDLIDRMKERAKELGEDAEEAARKARDALCNGAGSIIRMQNRVLGEDIDLEDTPFTLHYESDRVPGHASANAVVIPISDRSVPPSLKRIDVTISVAGRTFNQTYPGSAGQSITFIWDGKDAYGRELKGMQPLTAKIEYVYDGVYMTPAMRTLGQKSESFGHFTYFGVPASGNRTRQEVSLSRELKATIGGSSGWDSRAAGFGGWSLSAHHAYDPIGRIAYLGNGETLRNGELSGVMKTLAGGGIAGFLGDGNQAAEARLNYPSGLSVDPRGNIYVADRANHRVRKISAAGVISTVAGTGTAGSQGDSGLATRAELSSPVGVAVDGDGNLYIADQGNHRIRRVDTNGTITTVAGTGTQGFGGDDLLATQAMLSGPSGVAVDGHGYLYIADSYNHRVRVVTPNGQIRTVAGDGTFGFFGDSGPAPKARLNLPTGVAVDKDANLYIADQGNHRVRKVDMGGTIRTIAGTGTGGYNGEGTATQRQLSYPAGVAVDATGNVFIADSGNHRVRKLAAGLLSTVAGTGLAAFGGEGGRGAEASFNTPMSVVVDQEGKVLVADQWNHRIRLLAPTLPGFTGQALVVPSPSGDLVYGFDAAGRHLRTIDATGKVLFAFTYDASGRLSTVVDDQGRTTRVTRNANGDPTIIVAPNGRSTTLAVDSDGWLTTVTSPSGDSSYLSYGTQGLLTSLADKRGAHRYSYDLLGNLDKDEGPAGNFTQLVETPLDGGVRITATDQAGRVTTFEALQLANNTQQRVTVDPLGGRTVTSLIANGPTTVVTPEGSTSVAETSPDPRWGQQAPYLSKMVLTSPSGLTGTFTHDLQIKLKDPMDPLSVERITSYRSDNGKVTTVVEDIATRTTTITTPEGRVSKAVYDANGLLSSLEGDTQRLDPVKPTFDAQGRVSAVKLGSVGLAFGYDAQGRMNALAPLGTPAPSIGFDAAGRPNSFTRPSGAVETMTLDTNGRPTEIALPSGKKQQLAYDAFGRTTSYVLPGGATYGWTYNSASQIAALALPGGSTLQRTYDAGGRLQTVSYPEANIGITYAGPTRRTATAVRSPLPSGTAQTTTYAHDGNMLTQMSSSGLAAAQFKYRYDASFQLAGVAQDNLPEEVLRYDRDGLLSGRGRFSFGRAGPMGMLSDISDGVGTVSLTYDREGKVTRRTFTVGGSLIYSEQYTYDLALRVAKKVETQGAVTRTYEYSYDADGQLTQVALDGTVIEKYGYDADGNRLSRQLGTSPAESQSYDSEDRLSQRGTVAYAFDADGKLTQIGGRQLVYSATGELLSTSASGATITYGYDAAGQRVTRSEASGTTQYLRGNFEHPYEITAVKSPSGVLTRLYYDEGGVLFALERAGAWYYVSTDQLGSPRVVTDATGSVVKTITYAAYGAVTSDSNPSFEVYLGFAGGLYDAATGLVRFGVRDYDPEAGRWTARDPSLLAGGVTNLFMYAQNNPVLFRDRSGAIAPAVALAVGGGALIGGVAGYFSCSGCSQSGRWAAAGVGAAAGAAGVWAGAAAATTAAAYGAAATIGFAQGYINNLIQSTMYEPVFGRDPPTFNPSSAITDGLWGAGLGAAGKGLDKLIGNGLRHLDDLTDHAAGRAIRPYLGDELKKFFDGRTTKGLADVLKDGAGGQYKSLIDTLSRALRKGAEKATGLKDNLKNLGDWLRKKACGG
ncbi:MAG: hypothetical protein HYZ28_08390 [Myxococcales bacterium]|nr:hypothetical protein [Myxococcales bacterium]